MNMLPCCPRRPVFWMAAAILLVVVASTAFSQKYADLSLTPPMGWNSWNRFGCDVNEELIREIADAMVTTGMKDAGYQYINIDDCWHGTRDSLGFIHPDPKRFPSGIKALADYVHAKGLKLGIYSDAGYRTCGGKPASRGHEFQDAISYAQWGIDYVKYDWCETQNLNGIGAYTTMRDAIRSAGRPMVLSLCEWGSNKPWLWGKEVGHLWRTTGDISPVWDSVVNHGTWQSNGVLQILDMQKGLRQYAGPGHWNDPDMMEVGNGMTANEDRAHFSLWCMLAAPLIAGNDLRTMPKGTSDILENKEVIAVDQDSLGVEALKSSAKDSIEIWFKPLVGGDWAMCILNRNREQRKVSIDWQTENVLDSLSMRNTQFATTTYKIRDLWLKKELGTTKKPLAAKVEGHDILMVRLQKMEK
jgi:alpha-galactosidase